MTTKHRNWMIWYAGFAGQRALRQNDPINARYYARLAAHAALDLLKEVK